MLQLEWRQRRQGLSTNTGLRWTIVARWTVLFAAVAIVVDLAGRKFRGDAVRRGEKSYASQ